MSPHRTHLSARGIPLVFNGDIAPGTSVLTVECYLKWYTYVLLTRGAGDAYNVSEVCFADADDLIDYAKDGSTYVDHVPNPRGMWRLAERRGWVLDYEAYEMVIGRWEREARCNDEQYT